MIIHQRPRERPPWLRLPALAWRRARSSLAIGALGFALLVMTGATFAVSGVDLRGGAIGWLLDHGYEWQLNDRIRNELVRLPVDWARGLVSSPEVPRLYLDISFENIQRLGAQRTAALERGMMLQGVADEVPARLRLDSRSVRAKVRLKGDTPIHFERGRRSFRVEVKDGDAVFGMRRFSLQHPITRNYHTEPLFLYATRLEGGLAPRYRFVDVYVNGDFEGRLALEEHFSKELLESQGRRESVILRFDESEYWSGREKGFGPIYDNYTIPQIDAFQDAKLDESPVLSLHRKTATRLLEGFRRGHLPPADVFDVVATGRLIAIAEAWAAIHALDWRNIRFYYNPIVALIEPIAYDGKVLLNTGSAETIVAGRKPLVRALLADPAIRAVHRETLQRLALDLGQGGALADSLEARQALLLDILRRHYPLVRPLSLRAVAERAAQILALDEGRQDRFRNLEPAQLLFAERVETAGKGHLELVSRIPEPLTVLEAVWRDPDQRRALPIHLSNGAALPVVLPATPAGEAPERIRVDYVPPPDASELDLVVVAQRHGSTQRFAVAATSGVEPLRRPLLPASTIDQALEQHAFLKRAAPGRLQVLPGHWTVTRPLSLPPGVSLEIGPATTLAFGPGTWLLTRAPLLLKGAPEAPVTLTAADTASGWGGVAVLGAGGQSEWAHAVVERTTGIEAPGWSITAGVTFYESPVRLRSVRFASNRTEDALNIVRSRFDATDVAFFDTESDALDADFSDGRLENVAFEDIGWGGGGDAVDVSGATVTIFGARFSRITDKAISAGERSSIDAFDIEVRVAGAGAVSKDGSLLRFTNGSISGTRAGLMAYRKKPEYGQPRLEATSIAFADVEEEAVAQTGSTLVLDGRIIPTREVDVDRLYSTVMRKGEDPR